jgi:hypothetical protein
MASTHSASYPLGGTSTERDRLLNRAIRGSGIWPFLMLRDATPTLPHGVGVVVGAGDGVMVLDGLPMSVLATRRGSTEARVGGATIGLWTTNLPKA